MVMSLPTRERELKQRAQRPRGGARVAPHAGARIETFSAGLRLRPSGSLPTRERELKHAAPPSVRARDTSLPTRERELKQPYGMGDANCIGRSPRGSAN